VILFFFVCGGALNIYFMNLIVIFKKIYVKLELIKKEGKTNFDIFVFVREGYC